MLLEGKSAVITGAASERGIGKATARLFAEHGASIAILDLDADNAQSAADDIGPGHRGYACDVTDHEYSRECLSAVARDFGGIDIVIHAAGIVESGNFVDLQFDQFERMMAVNLNGTFNVCQASAKHMRKRAGGSIVCIASVAGQQGGGFAGGPHYAASKAAVIGLTKAMARQLGADDIRVNAVAPGLIDTDMTKRLMDDDVRSQLASAASLARIGKPEEIGGACLFLASELSSFVTGATIDVNGGLYLR